MAKQGFFNKLIMGSDSMPDFTPDKLPKSRWALYWDVLKNRFGAICKTNILTMLFTLPIIIVLVFLSVQQSAYSTMIPSTGNLGLGFPVVLDAKTMYNNMILSTSLSEYFFLIPCFMILSVGIAGCAYVSRRLVWGEGVIVGSNFGKGIKENWKVFAISGLLLSLSFFGMMFSFSGLDYFDVSSVIKVLFRIFGVFQFIFILSMYMYVSTQAVTYKLGFTSLVKNAFLFTVALLPQNVFFLFLSSIPVLLVTVLSSAMFLAVLGWIILVVFGGCNVIIVWTVFNHYVYDKYINDKVKGAVKNRNMYVKTKQQEIEDEINYIKNRNTIYGTAYASKKLSSIDKGQSFTPLTATFNRADLERLRVEKQAVRDEIEQEKVKVDQELDQKLADIQRIKANDEKHKGKKQ